MRSLTKFSFIILLTIFFTNTSYAVKNAILEDENSMSAVDMYLNQNELDVSDFLNLSVKTIRKETNKKLTFKEHVVFRVMKGKMYLKSLKNSDFDAEEYYMTGARRFNLGGFLLGLFFPIIGNLLAILFGPNAFRSSLYGTLVALILGLLGWVRWWR